MRVLVVATPRFPVPPEQLPAIIDGAIAWVERYQDRFECFGTFPGGGGFGAVNVSDESELNQMIVEMPFAPFMQHEFRPYTPGTAGMEQFREAVAAMAAQMGAS